MFERFTDRARRVVVLAQEEARLLNHNYIGTEHILLGLLREGEGVAAQVLVKLGANLSSVRQQAIQIMSEVGIESVIDPGARASAERVVSGRVVGRSPSHQGTCRPARPVRRRWPRRPSPGFSTSPCPRVARPIRWRSSTAGTAGTRSA